MGDERLAPLRRRRVLAGGVASLLAAGADAAVPADRGRFWDTAPRGLNLGLLRADRHGRPFLEQAAATGARIGRIFVDFVWVERARRYLLPRETVQAIVDVLVQADSVGLGIVFAGDFESAPNPPLWDDPGRAAAFAEAWRGIARLARGARALVGLDLLNEPNPPWSDGTDAPARRQWHAVATAAMQAVRAEDPRLPIVFQGIGGGAPLGLRDLAPFPYAPVVYSVHFYAPHPITHQQVSAHWKHVIPYPVADDALLQGSAAFPGPWNAARLRSELEPVRALQLRHRVPVFVGEFSCVRWAPGGSALRWLRDVLALFDEYGWSWAYHEFRGWPGWDAEVVDEDRQSQRRAPDAPAMQLLRRAMVRRP